MSKGVQMTKIAPADEATIRRFAASIRERGSRRTSPALRAEVRSIVLQGHADAAAAARKGGQPEVAKAHIAWVCRLTEL
ncbi:MAG: hypothetical protein ACR2J9_08790 [Gaiellales bacterium]